MTCCGPQRPLSAFVPSANLRTSRRAPSTSSQTTAPVGSGRVQIQTRRPLPGRRRFCRKARARTVLQAMRTRPSVKNEAMIARYSHVFESMACLAQLLRFTRPLRGFWLSKVYSLQGDSSSVRMGYSICNNEPVLLLVERRLQAYNPFC